MKKKGEIFIGTSGWHYKHWVGQFYPADIKDSEQLAYYQQQFNTVEINNSFYNLPLLATFSHWRDIVADDFVFAVKASRYITHMKKLNVERASMNKFFTRINKLQDKAGPILFQLPPKWNVNMERLENFLANLPAEHRYTVEFRNETWHTEDVYNLLTKSNIAFCIYELAGHRTPNIVTADFVYIRLHGPGDKYQGSYTASALRKWSIQLKEWQKEGRDVYCYFDNDQAGYAAANALILKSMVK